MVRSLVRVLALAAALVAPGASGLHGAPRVHRTPAATTTPAFVNGASPTQLRRQRVAPSLPGAGCTKTSTTVMSAVDPNNVMDVITQVAVAAKAVGTDMEIYVPPNPFQGSVDDGVHIKSWLGFLGGTVGVVGTLATYEMGRFRMKQRIVCPLWPLPANINSSIASQSHHDHHQPIALPCKITATRTLSDQVLRGWRYYVWHVLGGGQRHAAKDVGWR
mmetsp:Transcript_25985/g.69165  ORF Transcript_25985/g.69165 Transcript_25985/m.69165 type:complete len:218 (+) Transcript_25985:107-760(+)